MTRLVCLTLVLLYLAGCGLRTHAERRWIGDLTSIADPAACPNTRGVLTMRDSMVSFAPDEGVWVLTGPAGASTIDISRSRVTSDRKTYKTDLQARWTDAEIEGTYTTPQCKYQVRLVRF